MILCGGFFRIFVTKYFDHLNWSEDYFHLLWFALSAIRVNAWSVITRYLCQRWATWTTHVSFGLQLSLVGFTPYVTKALRFLQRVGNVKFQNGSHKFPLSCNLSSRKNDKLQLYMQLLTPRKNFVWATSQSVFIHVITVSPKSVKASQYTKTTFYFGIEITNQTVRRMAAELDVKFMFAELGQFVIC